MLFGEGVADWKAIFAAAEHGGGVEYYLIEQEGSRLSELETAQECLKTYRKIRASFETRNCCTPHRSARIRFRHLERTKLHLSSFYFPISIACVGRKERRATTTGTSHGARGFWLVGSGFAEVVRLVGSFSPPEAVICACAPVSKNPFESEDFKSVRFVAIRLRGATSLRAAKNLLTLAFCVVLSAYTNCRARAKVWVGQVLCFRLLVRD